MRHNSSTNIKNTLLLLALLALGGCATHPARTFSPTDTAAIGGAVTSTHEKIQEADKQAAVIERTGTVAGSKEVVALRLTLRSAENDALAAQKALDDFKLTDSRKFDDINREVKAQTARAESAEAKVSSIQPHLMRLRYLAGACVILGALAWALAPLARTTPYLMLIPSPFLEIVAVVVTEILLVAFLTFAGLVGWL